MQFMVPFIKICTVPNENFPPIPVNENVESTDAWKNNFLLDELEITESPEILYQPHSPQLNTSSSSIVATIKHSKL